MKIIIKHRWNLTLTNSTLMNFDTTFYITIFMQLLIYLSTNNAKNIKVQNYHQYKLNNFVFYFLVIAWSFCYIKA